MCSCNAACFLANYRPNLAVPLPVFFVVKYRFIRHSVTCAGCLSLLASIVKNGHFLITCEVTDF
jgi:hypothetical protein